MCYRVFLRDPVGWGYNVGSAALAGATARMVAEKARGEVKIVAPDDGKGIVRNLRLKVRERAAGSNDVNPPRHLRNIPRFFIVLFLS